MTELFRPTVDAFPCDGHPWRLDWIGDIFYQRHIRYKQPFIRIALSKVCLDTNGSWSYPARFYGPISQIQTAVPIGILPALWIGGIWQDGSIIAEPDYCVEFFNLYVDKHSTKLVKSGLAENDQSFLLPFNAHPYHKKHTHSYCLEATLPEGRTLIIPTTELIRFYFGSSSSLISRLFKAPFNESRLWIKAEMGADSNAQIDLAENISGASASDVARIAFNLTALHAARLIPSSLLAATGPDYIAYPKTHFPFTGNTRLRVKGIWLDKTFLVFQILSCSHPFPFDRLRYTMSKPQTPFSTGGGTNSNAENLSMAHSTRIKKENRTLVNNAPDTRLSTKTQRIVAWTRFPDLESKYVGRVDPITSIQILVSGGDGDGDDSEFSVGETEGRTKIRAVDLVSIEDALYPKHHPLKDSEFAKYVEQYAATLRQQGATVWFAPLEARQRSPQLSLMPEIVTGHGEIHPWSYIESENGMRPRYVSVLQTEKSEIREAHLVLEGKDRTQPGALFKTDLSAEENIDAVWVTRKIVGIHKITSDQ